MVRLRQAWRRITGRHSQTGEAKSGHLVDSATDQDVAHEFKAFFTPRNEGFPYAQVYKPLNTDTEQIRLLRLLPGDFGAPLVCELHDTVPMIDSPVKNKYQYEAVSYCAGDAADFLSLTLNGHAFNVFRSLWEALQRFRDPGDIRVLWIDQVCINQLDIAERDRQVLLMKNIYENAQQVLIWLGETGPQVAEVETAFALIDDFLAANKALLVKTIGAWSPVPIRTPKGLDENTARYLSNLRWWTADHQYIPISCKKDLMSLPGAGLVAANDLLARHDVDMAAAGFLNLTNRQWWSRCWVWQETLVAARPMLQCGPHRVAFDDLSLVNTSFGIFDLLDFQKMQEARQDYMFGMGIGGLRLYLMRTKHLQTSDPRDKIYSLLGLFTKEERRSMGIEPNYAVSNTPADVYTLTTQAIITVEQSWDILSDIHGFYETARLAFMGSIFCNNGRQSTDL